MSLFGSSSTSGNTFSFGKTATTSSGGTSLFGSSSKPAASTNLFGSSGFGAKSTASSTGGLFGSSGFGAKTTTTTASGGLFGNTTGFGAKTTTTSASSGGLFGGTSAFGQKSSTTTGTGLFGQTSASGGLFGSKTSGSGSTSLFGTGSSMFNSKPSGGLFGNTSTTTGGFGQTTNQQQNNDKAVELHSTLQAISTPVLFNDKEKDKIIASWNQLQAFWGNGRGFYKQDGSHVTFKPDSYFCRFKAVGYSLMPQSSDEQGLVALICNKKLEEMTKVGEKNIQQAIHKILGGQNNIQVNLQSIQGVPHDKCELTIFVVEHSSVTGVSSRRVLSSDLHAFLTSQNIKKQLEQQLMVEQVNPKLKMTSQQINRILAQPPAGIDPIVWDQAKKDNPDPEHMISVPMLGFSNLNSRLKLQQIMSKQQHSRLDIMSEGLEKARNEMTNTQAKIELYRRKLHELSHRLLQVVIMQEIVRKSGLAIQPEEDVLRVNLDKIMKQLNNPMQYKGRLNELLSQTRMHHYQQTTSLNGHNLLDNDTLNDIGAHLKKQQEGLNALVSILKQDFVDLKIIEKHLKSEPIRNENYPYNR